MAALAGSIWPLLGERLLREGVRACCQGARPAHGHRFLKPHLRGTAHPTPEGENAEPWGRIVRVAAFPIGWGWELAQALPQPQERRGTSGRKGGRA
ncbi:MAG: hypothetical protein J7452_13665 [Thermoflexus sp.]|nr:hypothetical protein [Thermoflexus sp.]